ncbi:MAG: hypothetical protein R3C11_02460 [Planctomycetaceae bacterium]
MSQSAQREFQHYLKELGLTLSAFHFPTRHVLHDPHQLDQRLNAVQQAFQFCAQMKSRVLLIDTGHLSASTENTQPELKLLKDILTDLARIGNHIGVTPCVTPAESRFESAA